MFRISRPQEFFPASVDEQLALISAAAAVLSDEDVAWISENRDFSEAERYRQKDEVDAALVASPIVSAERQRIESIFAEEPVRAGALYLRAYAKHMASLHDLFATAMQSDTEVLDPSFWKRVITMADADNAHAMYLSSDNWPFSVFHKLIDELAGFIGDDQQALTAILLAGVQDARTSVFNIFGNEYRSLDRQAFAVRVRERADWIRSDGVMPLFAFKAATESGRPHAAAKYDFSKQYEIAVAQILLSQKQRERQRFVDLCNTYQQLYAARAAYDIYEYFGFYAFARHLVIRRAMRELANSSDARARSFHYSASTYQFAELTQIMNLEYQEA